MRKLLPPAILLIFLYAQGTAQIINISGPTGSGKFGATITVLPNGNYVVTDPLYNDGAVSHVGAVYLFNGSTHSIISILKGSSVNDSIGSSGITVLDNGNFLIRSSNWDNGSIQNAGAVTWCSGTQGLAGIINSTNSLVGSSVNEQLGVQSIIKLTNGNFVVRDQNWSNGTNTYVGAAIWGNAGTPLTGVVSTSNALTGSQTNDRVGYDVIPLDNGNYVVSTPFWSNTGVFGAGAVTWCNGVTGLTGVVSSSNSLVGTHASDQVGSGGITKLVNGNFVVKSPNWNVFSPNPADMGAVTWVSGTAGKVGEVSSINSLTKTGPTLVGGPFVTALPNGNYVIVSPGWGKSGLTCAGAITWADGITGISGEVTSLNSIVGSNATYPAQIFIVPLTNGNYVIAFPNWQNGKGAVTWGNGTNSISGIITSDNSLTGVQAGDYVGNVMPLFNGNYVVCSPSWSDISASRKGAITWCNGTTGQTGFVTAANSLIGGHAFDQVGSGGIIPLQNNKYVVSSPLWDNGSVSDAGAVSLVDGAAAVSGTIDFSNSLIGTHTNDHIGNGGVAPLFNGNYVVASPDWDTTAIDVGAVTWMNANAGGNGIVGADNSMVGTYANDRAGTVIPLTNGNYVVMTLNWNNSAGAVTWGSGMSGISGNINATNSIVGSHPNDRVGFDNTIIQLNNSNYLVRSPYWANGSLNNAGAVTWCSGTSGTVGTIDSSNSLVGTHANDGSGYGVGYSISVSPLGNYAVRNMNWDNNATTDAGAVTWGNGSSGVSGSVTQCNSVQSEVTVTSESDFLPFSFNENFGYLVVGRPAENIVSIYDPLSMVMPSVTDSSATTIHGNTAVPLQSVTNCNILATLTPNGIQPVDGLVKAKTWVNSSPISYNDALYVGRHYEIVPVANAITATANVTLYFKQSDFDVFNAHPDNVLTLPVNENDNAGKAHLRIIKYDGVSNDGSGLPGSYTGNTMVIDPNDNKIVWNSTYQRWEVSFDVNGFSGFFVSVSGNALPVNLLSFTGRLVENKTLLEWQTSNEIATSSFKIERSKDGIHYTEIGMVAAFNTSGIHAYQFTDANPFSLGVPVVFYRLKSVDVDNSSKYSRVITITVDKNRREVLLFPNPVIDELKVFINTQNAEDMKGKIIDNVGQTIRLFEWNITAGSSALPLDVSRLASGTYYLELQGEKVKTVLLFFKN